jgi:hypothetical protein
MRFVSADCPRSPARPSPIGKLHRARKNDAAMAPMNAKPVIPCRLSSRSAFHSASISFSHSSSFHAFENDQVGASLDLSPYPWADDERQPATQKAMNSTTSSISLLLV